MACREIGFLGSNGITGGGIPIASGAALAAKIQGTGSVVLCFFGDGAANQGTFHESLNMASVWGLPVIYLCENNLYAMSTPLAQSTSVENIADRASGYGMRGRSVDGNDVLAVRDAVMEEAARARSGEPVLVECKTYRIHGHSRSDPCDYRPAEEEESWRKRDPLVRFGQELEAQGLLDSAGADRIRQEQTAIVNDAVQCAGQGDLPDPAELEGAQYA